MPDKHRILITNDDGIHAEGLTALESAMRKIGKVYVVAPESEMSGASHSLTPVSYTHLTLPTILRV